MNTYQEQMAGQLANRMANQPTVKNSEPGEISQQLHHQASLVEELYKVCSELSEKTNPVRVSEPEDPRDKQAVTQDSLCAVAHSIRAGNEAIQGSISTLRTILRTLSI